MTAPLVDEARTVRDPHTGFDTFGTLEGADAHRAARRVSASDRLGWERVHVGVWEEEPQAEDVDTSASPWHRIVLVTHGRYVLESRHGSAWDKALYGPGSIGLTGAGTSGTLRWRSATSEQLRSVHVHLDPDVVNEAVVGLAGRGAHGFDDALQLDDPQVEASVRDLAWALEIGAPPLYAEALAQILAAKLVTTVAPPRRGERAPGLDSRVLARVVEYMDANLGEPITLDDLGAVANLSKHHLLRQFKVSTGLPPHRFLHRIRMEHAERLLSAGDRTVGAVARVCGYASDRQFSAAFTRHAGMSPARWSDARTVA